MSAAFGFSERFYRLRVAECKFAGSSSRDYLVSLGTLVIVTNASHSYADHRHETKGLNLQGAEKNRFQWQNQTVTEDAVEINLSLTDAAISN
jgi:hypothetical protein